jgi:hypothetical protein
MTGSSRRAGRAAFNARRPVWNAMPSISDTICEIASEERSMALIAPIAAPTIDPA